MAGKYHHGNSPAAWTGVIIAIIGFSVGSAFTVMAQPVGVAGGAGIVALGGVVGLIMRGMGLGQEPAAARQAVTVAPAASAGASTSTSTSTSTERVVEGAARPEPEAQPTVA